MKRLATLAFVLMLLLSACGQRPWPAATAPLQQQAYVWRLIWPTALSAAVARPEPGLQGWRVLVAQRSEDEGWQRSRPDWAALAHSGLVTTAVVRLDAQIGRLNDPATDATAAATLQQLSALWRQTRSAARHAGAPLAGLEIDYDCASAQLAGYAAFLRALRPLLDGARLSITTRPAWLAAPKTLQGLLAEVDGQVLQVHSLSRPQQGLWSSTQTERWLREWARLSPGPFALALPSYGVDVRYASDGNVLAVDGSTSVAPRDLPVNSVEVELMADPLELARFLVAIETARPPRLQAVYWFHLPLAGDQRSYSPPSWALLRQQPLAFVQQSEAATLQLHAQAINRKRGEWRWSLRNPAAVDLRLPLFVQLPSACTRLRPAADLRAGLSAAALLYPETGRLPAPVDVRLLRSGEQMRLGVAHCPALPDDQRDLNLPKLRQP